MRACIAQRDKAQSPLILPTHKACNASFMVADELEALTADKAAAEGKGGQLTADLAMAKEDAMRERQAGEAARTVLTKATLNRQ